MKIIETERLILRTWQPSDAESYYQINQDPKVIEFLPGTMTMRQVEAFILSMQQQWETKHYTLWATEEKHSGKFIGFIGLNALNLDPVLPPSVEIGWRLGSAFWYKGYATEGAKASLQYGFEQCHLTEITAIAVPDNQRSLRVMDKIGLKRDISADFNHPRLPANHRLSRHYFYRIQNSITK